MHEAHSIELPRQLDAVRAEELRTGDRQADLAGRLRRTADRGFALLQAGDGGDWSHDTAALWEAHLIESEATARQEAPEAYERLRDGLAIESELPWTRATLLRLTPELITLDWDPVDEQQSAGQVADALAQNERIQRKLWRGSNVQQDLRGELSQVLAHDQQALRLARRLCKLGVTRLAAADSGWRSVAHGREVDLGVHEHCDVTALEAQLSACVRAWRRGEALVAGADQLTALEPGRGARIRHLLRRLSGLLPNRWRGTALRYVARTSRPPKK